MKCLANFWFEPPPLIHKLKLPYTTKHTHTNARVLQRNFLTSVTSGCVLRTRCHILMNKCAWDCIRVEELFSGAEVSCHHISWPLFFVHQPKGFGLLRIIRICTSHKPWFEAGGNFFCGRAMWERREVDDRMTECVGSLLHSGSYGRKIIIFGRKINYIEHYRTNSLTWNKAIFGESFLTIIPVSCGILPLMDARELPRP